MSHPAAGLAQAVDMVPRPDHDSRVARVCDGILMVITYRKFKLPATSAGSTYPDILSSTNFRYPPQTLSWRQKLHLLNLEMD